LIGCRAKKGDRIKAGFGINSLLVMQSGNQAKYAGGMDSLSGFFLFAPRAAALFCQYERFIIGGFQRD